MYKLRISLRDVARHDLPIFSFRKHFPGSRDKRAVRVAVSLKLVHQPSRGIAEIAVDTIHTGEGCLLAVGLSSDVIVIRADQRSFHLADPGRHSVVVGGDRLLT